MKHAYLISRDDMTPDHLRCGTCADALRVSRTPGETNSSHEERTEGWLGQTNNWSETALGEFDDFRALCDAIARSGFPEFDVEKLRNWCDSEPGDEDDDDFEIGPECRAELVISGLCGSIHLRPSAFGGYNIYGSYDVPAIGWSVFASYGDPYGWHLCPDAIPLQDQRYWEIADIASALNIAGVDYDRLHHEEGSSSDDCWSFGIICVRMEHLDAANATIAAAVAARG